MRFQRVVQALCLALFLSLLWEVSDTLAGLLPPDLFLRLDPLAALGGALAARGWATRLWPALAVLACTVAMGRFFCGHVCPLGASIDLADRLILGRKPKARLDASARPGLARVKHHVLLLVLGAGLLGVSLVFLAAPIPLATRFYGLVVQPMLQALAGLVLPLIHGLGQALDWDWLRFAKVQAARFAAQWFVLAMLGGVFSLALLAPRFWCRYLCPSGAVFALLSRRPLIRRRVSDACTECGLCARRCPMGAIPDNPRATRHAECIVCETCVAVCPEQAVAFAPSGGARPVAMATSPSRRDFLASGLAGAGVALAGYAGLGTPLALDAEGGGLGVAGLPLLRPPGAVPEPEFLARCTRCGACMAACPTNTLQPVWFEAGFLGLFSPTVTPLRGACEPLCTACGDACPTQAVRTLPQEDKVWAKLGTAAIDRKLCIAWEQDKACLVCDEVCPYDAVELRRVPEAQVGVPFVREDRCAGCGFCEHHCPVRGPKAIRVGAMGALRLSEGSHAEAAKRQGLDLSLRRNPDALREPEYDPSGPGLPPGFSAPGG